ncbi:MAG: AAA family ATPase [Alphaproteobacteria bacterium]|nr:AAA family ATPase [Alphaproteobacteria bacterium]MCB9691372.1 AAA family ATPase [Alphaproteobacteria bacterium]
MAEEHPIVREEVGHLRRVATLLEENPYQLPPSEKPIVEELLRLREELPKAKEEDKGALLMQYDQAHNLLVQLREARERPQVDPGCPYFAHVCLEEEGRQRHVFLGKATRIDNGLRIVDWRNAPISRIFYRYQQGEEYEEELGDRYVEGRVRSRRTLTIERGELERVDSPEGTFVHGDTGWELRARESTRLAGGQGAALRAHAAGESAGRRLGTDLEGNRRRRDKRLPDIAGLIDAEQFELITRPRSGFVVIRGTAGSGKTTVALHRIAWMAFEDPSYDSPQTLFLVFSRALKDYVGHVLPALGVSGAVVMDFRSWSHQARTRHFPMLPKNARETTPAVAVRLKQHPAMLEVLREQVRRVDGESTADQALDDWMSAVTGVDLLAEVLDRRDPGAFTRAELEKAAQWSHDRAQELMAWIEGDREVEAAIDVEDEPLLLRAWQLRVGPLRNAKKRPLRYKHLAIDEVQDFSPTEVRVLLDCLDEKQSITLAGDTQQHVMQESGFTSWADFFRHLGVEGTSVDTLRISYRSAAPIVDLAMRLLGPLREDDEMPVVTRSGPPVELFRFTDHGAAVAFLADALKELLRAEPMASVVLLTPDQNLSGVYTAGLRAGEVPRLRRVSQQDFTFAPGVEVTELDQVKGLEFDYVVLIEPSAAHFPDTAAARRLLHVGATRAVHQLWMTCVAEPSTILAEALGG